MRRHQLSLWMLGIAVASAIALTGCDDVLGELQKGLLAANTSAYGIALSKEAYEFPDADTKLALRIINTGTEPTGVLTAELSGDSEAFKLSKEILPSIKFGKSSSLKVTVAANLAAGPYETTVLVSGDNGLEATLDVSFTVEEAEETATEEKETASADETEEAVPEMETPTTKEPEEEEESDEEAPVAVLTPFAEVLVSIAKDAGKTEASYSLPIGAENHTGAITLTTANSPASVVIDGGGRVVTGNAKPFTIESGVTLTLKNITFTKLPLTVSAGGSLVLDTGVDVHGNEGAGITVSGTLEMKHGASVTQNSASGVVLGANAVFTMNGGSISGNIASVDGGGVAIDGENSVFTMNGGSISGNVASVDGGGVAIDGENSVFNMNGGSISENVGRGNGGGVAIGGEDGVFTMMGGIISGNTASTENGGGVHILSGCTFNMTGGVITGNATVVGNGGGVFIEGTFIGDPSIGVNISGIGAIYHNVPDDLRYDDGLERSGEPELHGEPEQHDEPEQHGK